MNSHPSSSPYVKIFGERHTGTNFLERVLRRRGILLAPKGHYLPLANKAAKQAAAQLGISMSRQGLRWISEAIQDDLTIADGPLGMWKHCAPRYHDDFLSRGVLSLFLVKSPGAWITSFFKRPYHRLPQPPKGESLDDFLEAPWITVRREMVEPVLPGPLELWNRKTKAYLRFSKEAAKHGGKTHFIRAEDLVLRQAETLVLLAEFLGIEPALMQRVSRRVVRGDATDFSDLEHRYETESWREALTERARLALDRTIDWEIAARFGYARLKGS